MSSNWQYWSGAQKGLGYAMEAHSGQFRKEACDGHPIPFIVHPADVLKRVWSWGLGSDLFMHASALHDVLEDCPGTTLTKFRGASGHGIQDVFGQEVANIVVELTFKQDEHWTPQESKREKAAYMASFRTKSLPALLIKLADRFCNVHDFILTNPQYAWKYLRKADPLFEAANERMQEIIEEYGEDVILAIRRDYRLLCVEMENEDDFFDLFP